MKEKKNIESAFGRELKKDELSIIDERENKLGRKLTMNEKIFLVENKYIGKLTSNNILFLTDGLKDTCINNDVEIVKNEVYQPISPMFSRKKNSHQNYYKNNFFKQDNDNDQVDERTSSCPKIMLHV